MQAPLSSPPSPVGLYPEGSAIANTLEQLRRLHSFLVLKSQIRKKAIGAREIMPIYWRRLIEVGVPIDCAKAIAWVIVRYDAADILPKPEEQQMIKQYCRFICRAGLWRSQLLTNAAV